VAELKLKRMTRRAGRPERRRTGCRGAEPSRSGPERDRRRASHGIRSHTSPCGYAQGRPKRQQGIRFPSRPGGKKPHTSPKRQRGIWKAVRMAQCFSPYCELQRLALPGERERVQAILAEADEQPEAVVREALFQISHRRMIFPSYRALAIRNAQIHAQLKPSNKPIPPKRSRCKVPGANPESR
jgi:hypothetical protein